MTDTPAPAAPASLAARARAAASHRTGTEDPAWYDIRWLMRAHQCAQRLALILGITADRIQIDASTVRRYGGWPWPELTVTDHGTRFRFIAAYGDPGHITALQPCPSCTAEVPTFPIYTLADLGDLLGTGSPQPPASAFDHDPGHRPRCPHAAPTPAP